LKEIDKNNYYDAVFAMSVLCRWPETKNKQNCKNSYSFNKFNEQVRLINRLVKPTGILIIYNTNFRFTDTEIADYYIPIQIPEYNDSGFVTKFSSENKYLIDQEYKFSIFRKKIP
jgi:hypothetical protein